MNTRSSPYWRERRVGVTGGTGFVGFQIVRQLLSAGAHVTCASLRPPDDHPLFQLDSVQKHFGDICDAAFVREALAGCDTVFHTAGLVGSWGPAMERMQAVHVTGTRNVLEAISSQTRLVHTSSVVAVGAARGSVFTEESNWNLAGLRVAYVQAKRAAEELAQTAAAQGRDVVTVNPGYIVGPEDYSLSVMGRFCRRFWNGRIPICPRGGLNLVDVRDAATGHLLAAQHGLPGRRYILGGENISFPKLLALLASVAGMRPIALPSVPHWVEWGLAGAAELYGALWKLEPYPSFQHVRSFQFTWFYDCSRAHRELGFCPRPLRQSLLDAFQWHHRREPMHLRGVRRLWMRPNGWWYAPTPTQRSEPTARVEMRGCR